MNNDTIALMESIHDQLMDAFIELRGRLEPVEVPYSTELESRPMTKYWMTCEPIFEKGKDIYSQPPTGFKHWPQLVPLAKFEKRMSNYIARMKGGEPER